jgi:hypothetical protein
LIDYIENKTQEEKTDLNNERNTSSMGHQSQIFYIYTEMLRREERGEM